MQGVNLMAGRDGRDVARRCDRNLPELTVTLRNLLPMVRQVRELYFYVVPPESQSLYCMEAVIEACRRSMTPLFSVEALRRNEQVGAVVRAGQGDADVTQFNRFFPRYFAWHASRWLRHDPVDAETADDISHLQWNYEHRPAPDTDGTPLGNARGIVAEAFLHRVLRTLQAEFGMEAARVLEARGENGIRETDIQAGANVLYTGRYNCGMRRGDSTFVDVEYDAVARLRGDAVLMDASTSIRHASEKSVGQKTRMGRKLFTGSVRFLNVVFTNNDTHPVVEALGKSAVAVPLFHPVSAVAERLLPHMRGITPETVLRVMEKKS